MINQFPCNIHHNIDKRWVNTQWYFKYRRMSSERYSIVALFGHIYFLRCPSVSFLASNRNGGTSFTSYHRAIFHKLD